MRRRRTVVHRALLIANQMAGTNSPALVAKLVALCRRFVARVEIHLTAGPGDATEVAQRAATRPETDRPEIVLAVGGDGTVREVVAGLVAATRLASVSGAGGNSPDRPDTTPALLVIPAGTGNSNYLAQWGNLPWPDAVMAALSPTPAAAGTGSRLRGEVRLLDLCRLVETDALVMLGACSGLIAKALTIAPDVPLTGRSRYQVALSRAAAGFVAYPGRVEVDGTVVHEGPTVLANVGGGRHRGGQYEVLPYSVLDDGLLDVCVIGADVAPVDVPELTRNAQHLARPGTVYSRGRRIVVSNTAGDPLWFEHDGELLPMSWPTVTLDVLPQALPVFCRAGRLGRSDGSRPGAG
ncbi:MULTISPECIES: diacylglycerol kinase family protein [unclassified Solwaraspora]|uniref:diacylglycerol/lipid kinase family protein n=1 Tax=unclassified Solwaraspora TaxID=2627926 RepID=UPI00248CE24E|nr:MULTISPECIES: diacylglycerol kinase family protein [unclassified Solwaraspora]WBB95655.1 diacylglycerol kinase family protein [Solwaraspora sp. WMMA2059]WBC20443.1 diacylglycerol kinase family protein [Solwaraspora sp. WMMA2080]WJK37406.1 diacylglycerol kinase family protein [Solwaraspora sp. WMMA2065]